MIIIDVHVCTKKSINLTGGGGILETKGFYM